MGNSRGCRILKEQTVVINTDGMESPLGEMSYEAMKYITYQRNAEMKMVVIVLAYGKYEKTKMCVENILKYTSDVLFELWLIDNGSVEDNIMELYEAIDYEPKKIIRITKNISAIFAMNVMMHSVKSEFFVFVNNDVVVTKNWLKNLLICAESDSKIGVVCPVSTNVSNRQMENLGGFVDLEEMQEKAAIFNKSDKRKWEERLRIIPTATLYRKEAVDEIGVFDIGFQHDFGDDDYFFRMRRSGYRLIVCRDTFVHHDHAIQERDLNGLEKIRSQKGRESFRKKYHNLDAWSDGDSHIKEFFYFNELCSDKRGQVNILGVDTRCGAPILDVKNKLKAEGYFKFAIDSFTTDLKYYIDLNSISDNTSHGYISSIISQYRDRKFQFVVLGEPLNRYQKPEEVLLDLVSLTAPGGILLFYIYNTDNIYEFLWQQGLLKERRGGEYQRMSYGEVFEILKNFALKKAYIDFEEYQVSDDIRSFTEQRAYPGLSEGKEEQIQNLYIEKYWFWLQKND